MAQTQYALEIKGRVGETFDADRLSALAGCHRQTVYNRIRKAAPGQWFRCGRLTVRLPRATAQPNGDPAPPAIPGTDRARLTAALERGQAGIATAGDVIAALGWLSRMRRQAEQLEQVLAGQANLTLDHTGAVLVVGQDVPKGIWPTPEEMNAAVAGELEL